MNEPSPNIDAHSHTALEPLSWTAGYSVSQAMVNWHPVGHPSSSGNTTNRHFNNTEWYKQLADVIHNYHIRANAEDETREKKENMRGLFYVYIIDTTSEPESIYIIGPVIATSEERAKMAALLHRDSPKETSIEDLDFVVQKIGNIRAKKE